MARNRYDNIPVKIGDNGKRVSRSVIYPPIPRDVNDIYVITTIGDRLDLLAKKYYGSVGHWWVIAQANEIGKGSLTLPVGIQLRIPANVSTIIRKFEELNQ
jgi:phage tail protein X